MFPGIFIDFTGLLILRHGNNNSFLTFILFIIYYFVNETGKI